MLHPLRYKLNKNPPPPPPPSPPPHPPPPPPPSLPPPLPPLLFPPLSLRHTISIPFSLFFFPLFFCSSTPPFLHVFARFFWYPFSHSH
ncbi:hypothetical protein NP493_1714g00001 [Ridgeia piscesae]|uniref:Uncharacterized protein n=1 Tax=Ridgeia piscesae TaxID=27915 RepID=A0AAD9JU93_RIDPI|nr:hypothetical protein NP493_1714g00001 [Ridgeia piscesae]